MLSAPAKQKLLLYPVAILAIAILLFVAYLWLALSWSYSSGERAGFMQKLSKKGWICKTWEGELSLIAIPGAAPEKFLFTVRDDAVAKRVDAAMGRRVSLVYEQHKGLPGNCFGETDSFVIDIKEIAQ